MRVTRSGAVGAITLAVAVVAAACGSGDGSKDTTAGKTTTTTSEMAMESITVASANFPESEMLADMYGAVLANAGYPVTYKLKLGSREVIQPALESGKVEFVPEYAGNYLSFLDKTTGSLPLDETLAKLRSFLTPKMIAVLEASPATDADAIAVTKDFATKNGLKTISDLTKVTTPLTLGGPPECETRQTCLLGLQQVYGLTLKFKPLDGDGPLTRAALDKGDIQLARVFDADADLKTKGYVVLETTSTSSRPATSSRSGPSRRWTPMPPP